ncbi:MAG: hypothetical protein GVY29_12375 [Spirochaetes bacterium]|jgi:hypothetical protein|nr:hypothetical protein [Spirochaetota bacterium]
MARSKIHEYLIDGLTEENAQLIHKGLESVLQIEQVWVIPRQNLVRVRSKGDVTDKIKIACDIAKTRFRTKVS